MELLIKGKTRLSWEVTSVTGRDSDNATFVYSFPINDKIVLQFFLMANETRKHLHETLIFIREG